MEIDALSLDLQNKSYDFNPFTKRERGSKHENGNYENFYWNYGDKTLLLWLKVDEQLEVSVSKT